MTRTTIAALPMVEKIEGASVVGVLVGFLWHDGDLGGKAGGFTESDDVSSDFVTE